MQTKKEDPLFASKKRLGIRRNKHHSNIGLIQNKTSRNHKLASPNKKTSNKIFSKLKAKLPQRLTHKHSMHHNKHAQRGKKGKKETLFPKQGRDLKKWLGEEASKPIAFKVGDGSFLA